MYYFMYLGPISRMLGLVGQQKKKMIIIVIVLHLPAALSATQSSYSLNFSINLDAFCCNTGMHRRIWTATMVTACGKFRFIGPEKQNHVEVALLS